MKSLKINGCLDGKDGYSAFSVSRSIVPKVVGYISIVPKVVGYIKNQRLHHSNVSFEDEYLELLRLHDFDLIDESHVFG